MASFQTIQGKTLEQIQANVSKIAIGDLLDFFNQYSGKTAIKKFKTRADGEGYVSELLGVLIEKKTEGEKKAGKANGKVPAISAKGWEMLTKIRECLVDWKDEKVTVEDMATELSSPEPTTKKTMDVLVKDGFMKSFTDTVTGPEPDAQPQKVEAYVVTEQGDKAKAPGKKGGTEKKGATGPKSSMSGKKITRLHKGNPSRDGSKRSNAWNHIKDGMTYEEYLTAGGNAFDLGFFLIKGYIKVK